MPPCDSISLCRVDLGLANQSILGPALESIADPNSVHRYGRKGWAFTKGGEYYRIDDSGRLVCQEGQEAMADTIKRAYSRKVVEVGAKKFGWTVNAKTPMKLTVKRRY
jgi:hypothetical protein